MTLLSVQAARERILTQLQPIATETLPLIQCANRVLAQDIAAATDLPLFDNSAMDGFALRSTDTVTAAAGSNMTLSVVADIPAGANPQLTLAQDGLRVAKLTSHQGSGNLLSLIQANALLIIPAGVKCVPAGREVNAWLL